MNDEKWQELVDTLDDKFELEFEKDETIQKDDVGQEIISKIDRLIFEGPIGKMKVERVTRPKILDKKVHYSHTSGNKGLVEYVLSPDETSQKVTVYTYDADSESWNEISQSEGMTF